MRLRQRKRLFLMTESGDQDKMEKRGAEIPVRLSMWRQCGAICVKRAIYFSQSWRECPQRNFGREESDSVRLYCERAAGTEESGSRAARRQTRYLLPGRRRSATALVSIYTALSNAIICTKGKFEMRLTHCLTDADVIFRLATQYIFQLKWINFSAHWKCRF